MTTPQVGSCRLPSDGVGAEIDAQGGPWRLDGLQLSMVARAFESRGEGNRWAVEQEVASREEAGWPPAGRR